LEFLNSIIYYDKETLLYLHSLGNPFWDSYWLFITNPINWIPLIFIIFFLGFKIFGFKKSLFVSIWIASSGAIALAIVNSIKNYVQRVRPINDISINTNLRVIIEANDFSFVSGHSTVSFTIAFISYWILKKEYNFTFLVFLFPILFAYSRIYLAAHFPLDILVGMFLGYIIALVFYKLIQLSIFNKKLL